MLKAAQWALRQEERILKKHCTAHPEYTLTIVGHSLGAGVASLLCVLLHDNPAKVGAIAILVSHSSSKAILVEYDTDRGASMSQLLFCAKGKSSGELASAKEVSLI